MFHLLLDDWGDNVKLTVSIFYCCLINAMLHFLLVNFTCDISFTVG